MTELGFYHLTRSTLDQALPKLLSRALAAGQRALVLCAGAEQMAALDASLWAGPELWLPHGAASDPVALRQSARQPIWLTTEAEPLNGASFLFRLAGAAVESLERFERVFDLFDGGDPDQVAAARIRWTEAKAAGLTPVYWRQTEKGWEKAA